MLIFRPEGDGLLVGLFEPEGACWNLERIPDDASFLELPPDWDRLTPFLERAFLPHASPEAARNQEAILWAGELHA